MQRKRINDKTENWKERSKNGDDWKRSIKGDEGPHWTAEPSKKNLMVTGILSVDGKTLLR
jgi:hypothetical protein